jgi:hypothetical protein
VTDVKLSNYTRHGEKVLENIQVSGNNADTPSGGSSLCTKLLKKYSTTKTTSKERLSRCSNKSETTKRVSLPVSAKKSMTESLPPFHEILIPNQSNWLHLVHANKEVPPDTLDLFKRFLQNPDKTKMAPIEPNAACGRLGLFRVRVDNSEFRMIVLGRVEFDDLWLYSFSFFRHDKSNSYNKYLKDVDVGTFSEAKKKKKKTAMATFYGKGDGKSGATMPPFRDPSGNASAKLGPSKPGPTGMNHPMYGTLPAGPTAPMVTSDSSFEDALSQFQNTILALGESMHVCLVCNGSGHLGGTGCPICSVQWNSDRARTPEESASEWRDNGTVVVSRESSDAALFAGLNRGWDLESKGNKATLNETQQIWNKSLTSAQFRDISKRLIPTFVVNDKGSGSKFDVFVDKGRGATHVLKSVYDGRGWETAQTTPERATSLTHVGVFDSPRSARTYLSHLGLQVI